MDHAHQPAPEPPATLRLDYDVICGRLLVTAARGGFLIFYGVPLGDYLRLRFSDAPEKYLKDRIISQFAFVCSNACWPES